MTATDLDQLCINTIRTLSIDAVQKANSGHPGTPMGAAPVAYVLWTRFLKYNPGNPDWPNRDRFVLSAGHASMLLYSLLYLTGYDLPMEELQRFRQWGSRTPGHPEHGLTPGVEATTGPLGQGFGNGVGMAIAERYLASTFNRDGYPVVDHYVYSLVSDGDLMEGVSSEAASLAGHLGLGRLIYIYDDNEISIEGSTDLAFTEDVGKRFEAYRWHVQHVDGNDLDGIAAAIELARAEEQRPSLIISRSTIAFGSPNKAGTAETHGAPLGEEEVLATKRALGWPEGPPFYVPDEALARFRQALERGRGWEGEWRALFERYRRECPDEARTLERAFAGELSPDWDADLPSFAAADGPVATRVASGKVINAIAGRVPTLIGGSGDLAPSTSTLIKSSGDFAAGHYGERNLRFGVREHAMGAVVNGMALHGGLVPYGATFLIFSDYMRPTIRLAALTDLHVIYVFTHDSVGLGEDGPTHQPIEHLPALRAIPNLTVIRPCDAAETAEAWRVAIGSDGPVALALTRQNLPVLDRSTLAPASELTRGAYVLAEADGGSPDLLLIATGSEVHPTLEARALLAERGVRARVVAMPSWELFELQSAAYRDEVLPPDVRARVAVEAASPLGWERYVGTEGVAIGMRRFGASAPGKVTLEQFGFTGENIAERAVELLERAGVTARAWK